MYTGSLAEVFNYKGEDPPGFWQPAQVCHSSVENMEFSLLGREALGGRGRVGGHFS